MFTFLKNKREKDNIALKNKVKLLSMSRPVNKSSMNAQTIKEGVKLRHKALTDPEFASSLIKKMEEEFNDRKK